jgi:hypothetical protein
MRGWNKVNWHLCGTGAGSACLYVIVSAKLSSRCLVTRLETVLALCCSTATSYCFVPAESPFFETSWG